MPTFRHTSRASQGARSYQEDASAVWPGPGPFVPAPPAYLAADATLLAVLADGMGGHAGGALASNTICSVFLERFAGAGGPAWARLEAALVAANDAIRAKVERNASLDGMGATLVALALGEAGAQWVSVGDSPMFLFRGGELARLNEDHSLAPMLDRLVAEGRLSALEAREDPRRHYLRSAVTGDELELVDRSEKPLLLGPGDILIVASDGLLTLEDDEIAAIVAGRRQYGPDAVADGLMAAVDAAGDPRQDNTTLIVVVVD